MKTHSAIVRLCLASLPALALAVSAAETERRENSERSPEPRPGAQAAPHEGPRGEARPQNPGPRRPTGEVANPPANRPEGDRAFRAPNRDGGNPQEREQHLRQAIEHLRLAGINDLADHLQQNLSGGNNPSGANPAPQANREHGGAPGGNHPNFQPPGGASPQGRNFTPPMAGGTPGHNVQPPMAGGSPNELRALHEEVAQLKRMVEELARQRR